MIDSFVVHKDCVYEYYGLLVDGKFKRLDDNEGFSKRWLKIHASPLPKIGYM